MTAITAEPGGSALRPDIGSTWGWQFVISSDITVTELGVNDFGTYTTGALTNTQDHDVGIFNSGGTLVVSGTVAPTSSAPDANGFVYTAVTQTPLAPGTYQIGAFFKGSTNGDNDQIKYNTASVTTSPEIGFVPGGFVATGSSLTNPTTQNNNGNAYFGPNFQFFDTVSTPEPSAFVMSGLLALGGLGYFWRQRRRSERPEFTPGRSEAGS